MEPHGFVRGAGLARRIVSVVLLAIAFMILVSGTLGYFRDRHTLAAQIGRELLAIVQTAAPSISGDAQTRVVTAASPEFQEIRARLRQVRDANDLQFDAIYTLGRDPNGGLVFKVMPHDDQDTFIGATYGGDRNTEVMAIIEGVWRDGKAAATPVWEDPKGTWISAFAPIRDGNGEIVGLLEADSKVDVLNSALETEMGAAGSSLLAGLLLAAAVGVYFAQRVAAPLVEVQARVRDIAEGDADLTQQVTAKSRDEVGELAFWLNRFIGKLREVVASIMRATSEVNALADSSSSDSRRVRDGANEQLSLITQVHASVNGLGEGTQTIGRTVSELAMMAAESSTVMLEMDASIVEMTGNVERLNQSIQSTSTSITEMTSAIKTIDGLAMQLSDASLGTSSAITELEASAKQVEQNALETAAFSEGASQAALSGREAVGSTANGMTQINNSTQLVAESIAALAKRSREIGEILTVIEDVADQTNLLALNAAIIAAQAGEKGKGFNVVAEEIRDLAGRTQNSTKEIGKLIASVQKEAKQAVEVVAGNARDVATGLKLAQQAMNELDRILERTSGASERVKEIARATQEQTHSSRQVMQAAERISDMSLLISKATKEQAQVSTAIEQAVDTVRSFSQQTARSFHEQTQGSREVTRNMEAIVDRVKRVQQATEGQSAASERIAKVMEKILSITNRNFELVDTLAGASDRLRASVTQMTEQVQRFRT